MRRRVTEFAARAFPLSDRGEFMPGLGGGKKARLRGLAHAATESAWVKRRRGDEDFPVLDSYCWRHPAPPPARPCGSYSAGVRIQPILAASAGTATLWSRRNSS